MLDLVSLADRLRRHLPADALLASPAEFVVDGREPTLVVSPASPEEVAATLAVADDADAAVSAWGGGAHMTLGAPPSRYDLALDLLRLDRIVEHEPADLTVTVEAGLRLVELQRRLGERGQWLPLDPPGAAIATVGGVLASNASGPARVAYGTARDLLIGITVATAGGELVKSGGRVVKNVAGYDMGKLQIGALGTLGVIVQASFKVQPLPHQSETVLLAGNDLDAAVAAAHQVWDAGLALNGLALSNRRSDHDATWTVSVRLAGVAAAVERSRRDLGGIATSAGLRVLDPSASPADVWADLADLRRPASPAGVVVRASVRPSEVGETAAALVDLGCEVVAYPSVGALYGRWRTGDDVDPTAFSGLRARCETAGGALVVEAAPIDLKGRLGVWGASRADFDLMRRLKAQFDPRGILSPGRYVGGI